MFSREKKRMGEEEMRRGLWSEQEDVQLGYYVKLFGDRRWDFISKVSGLKRTGKSCRLRWVNYLDPELKHGKMTPHEERLIIQLHSKLGNRWSRIASKLPGRTDNEIKNFWRTYMRHKAQEKKSGVSSLSMPTPLSSSFSESNNPSTETNSSSSNSNNTEALSFCDSDGIKMFATEDGDSQIGKVNEKEYSSQIGKVNEEEYSMDDIWRNIDESENNCDLFHSRMDSPIWNFFPDVLWTVDQDEMENFPIITDQIFECCDHVASSSIAG